MGNCTFLFLYFIFCRNDYRTLFGTFLCIVKKVFIYSSKSLDEYIVKWSTYREVYEYVQNIGCVSI